MAEEKLVLKPGVVAPFLSGIAMSDDGENFLFTELDMSEKHIEQLNKTIDEAKEVWTCNLSGNNIKDPGALQTMANVIHLDLRGNKINNLSIFTNEELFLNLKWLDVGFNAFKEFPAFKLPKLEYLDVSSNKLEKINEGWQGHQQLKILKAGDNKFKNMNLFKGMPKLEELYAPMNAIITLGGYADLGALKKLHLRGNKIENIAGGGDDGVELPELPALTYLNLRSNQIKDMDSAFKLFAYASLKDLNLINNPCELAFSSMNMMVGRMLIKAG